MSNFVSMELKRILKYFLNEMISYDVLLPLNIISVFEAAGNRPHPSDIYRMYVLTQTVPYQGLPKY